MVEIAKLLCCVMYFSSDRIFKKPFVTLVVECMPNGEFVTALSRAGSSVTIQRLRSSTIEDWTLLACCGGRCGGLPP